MACKEGIMAGIIYRVVTSERPEFGSWRIVLSNDPKMIRAEWGKPVPFFSWEAESGSAAQTIATYFVQEKGMIGGHASVLDRERPASVCLFPCGAAPARKRRRPARGQVLDGRCMP